MWCLPWKTKFLSVFTFLRCSVLPRLCSPPLFKTKEAILQPYFDQDPLPFLEGVEVTQPVGLSILFAHTLIGTHIASVNVLLHSLSKKEENPIERKKDPWLQRDSWQRPKVCVDFPRKTNLGQLLCKPICQSVPIFTCYLIWAQFDRHPELYLPFWGNECIQTSALVGDIR